MLSGFSVETKPLSEQEKELLPHVVKGLSHFIGSANAISNKEISEKIYKKHGVKLSDARIRKIINHIRVHGLLPGLVANGCGYYITHNIVELKKYDQSLEGRESAIHAVRMKVKEHIVKLQSKQQFSINYK
jgi:hypothetical protein